MSDHKPITGELRAKMQRWGWVDEDGKVTFSTRPPSYDADDAEPFLTICGSDFDRLCDAIDAVHANLERENDRLRRELDRVLRESNNQGDSMHKIGSATVTITPTLDWSGVARELRTIADTLAGDAE